MHPPIASLVSCLRYLPPLGVSLYVSIARESLSCPSLSLRLIDACPSFGWSLARLVTCISPAPCPHPQRVLTMWGSWPVALTLVPILQLSRFVGERLVSQLRRQIAAASHPHHGTVGTRLDRVSFPALLYLLTPSSSSLPSFLVFFFRFFAVYFAGSVRLASHVPLLSLRSFPLTTSYSSAKRRVHSFLSFFALLSCGFLAIGLVSRDV